jgi:hypothetical protein
MGELRGIFALPIREKPRSRIRKKPERPNPKKSQKNQNDQIHRKTRDPKSRETEPVDKNIEDKRIQFYDKPVDQILENQNPDPKKNQISRTRDL